MLMPRFVKLQPRLLNTTVSFRTNRQDSYSHQAEPKPSTTPPSVVVQRLQHWSSSAASVVRTHADRFTSLARSSFSQLGSQLNKVTGYDEIEVLKQRVVDQEARIHATRQAAREAKAAYEMAVSQRSKSQREVNDLLQRKSSWTDSDVSRFTSLVRQDHLLEQEETHAKAGVENSDDAVEREFNELMRSILARYHEEQVWSDKIRSASTYGSLAVLGLNLIVFIMAILIVEPWKRRRLAQTFERKIEQLSHETADLMDERMQRVEVLLGNQRSFIVTAMQQQRLPLPSTENEGNVAQLQGPTDDSDKVLHMREVGAIVTASAVTAAVAGWLARTWFGR